MQVRSGGHGGAVVSQKHAKIKWSYQIANICASVSELCVSVSCNGFLALCT